jgi:hypothetical protein
MSVNVQSGQACSGTTKVCQSVMATSRAERGA